MELLREKIREEIEGFARAATYKFVDRGLVDSVVDRIMRHIRAAANSENLQTQEFLDE